MFLQPRSLPLAATDDHAERVETAPRRRGELAPHDVFAAVWQRRWTVCCVFVLCVAAAIAYLKLATPLYTATSRLYVTPDLPQAAGFGGPERSKNYLNTQCELLRSTPILGRVAEMAEVKAMNTFAGAGAIAPALKEQLRVELGNKDDLIELSLDSTDPHEAARVVNAVVESYVGYQTAQKRTSATEMLKILRKERDAREQELVAQRLEVLKFKQQNPVLSLQNERGGIVLQRLAQLSEAKTAAQMQLMESAAAYEVVRAALSDPVRRREMVAAMVAGGPPSVLDRGRAALQNELYQSELRLDPMRRQLGPSHPSVKALTANIAETHRKLAQLDVEFVKTRLTSLEQTWLAAKQRLADIDKAFQEQRTEALELNGTAATLAVLESGVEQAQKLVDGIEERIKVLGVDGETGGLNVTVLEWAAADPKPSKPRKPLVLVAASLLGLVLGSSLAFVRASTDRRLRSSEQIEDALGIPVLSAVPRIKRRLRFGPQPTGPVGPESEAADAYRTIRTAIVFSNRSRRSKTLVVTSAVKGEGKSTLASNLAAAMAHAGERTLVIDADLRRPTQHRAFLVENRVGLSTVLSGQAEPQDAVRNTGAVGLDLLPSGPIPPNPSELLSSRRFAEVLAQLSQSYDRIVLDAPPVLGMADALVLGARSDATLLVVRADVSDRRATEAAYAALVNIGVRSIATVVNAVRRRNSYSRYGCGYYRDDRQAAAVEPFEMVARAQASAALLTAPVNGHPAATGTPRTGHSPSTGVVPPGWDVDEPPRSHGGGNGTRVVRRKR